MASRSLGREEPNEHDVGREQRWVPASGMATAGTGRRRNAIIALYSGPCDDPHAVSCGPCDHKQAESGMKRSSLMVAIIGSMVLGGASPAGAQLAEKSQGVGVCMSQVAIRPDLVEASTLGEFMRNLAGPGDAGSNVASELEGFRNACGPPPGPGHLR